MDFSLIEPVVKKIINTFFDLLNNKNQRFRDFIQIIDMVDDEEI